MANTEILESRILVATFDSRTTLLCRGRDGKEWDISDMNYPRLPFHFNERSVYVVRIKDADKDDISSENMDSWLRRQPKKFVIDSIGPARAELFLKGKLSIDKFTDLTGRTLTLDELRIGGT